MILAPRWMKHAPAGSRPTHVSKERVPAAYRHPTDRPPPSVVACDASWHDLALRRRRVTSTGEVIMQRPLHGRVVQDVRQ